MFARLKQRHASVLSDHEPFVLPQRNLSRGRRSLYMVLIGVDSRRRRQAFAQSFARAAAPALCRRTEA
jgi:hypothetical protein